MPFNLNSSVEVEEILPQNLAIGYKGTIKAEVYGMPRKKMEWLKDGKKIASLDSQGKMIFNDLNKYTVDLRGSLIINKVQNSDKGSYQLRVATDTTRITKDTDIDVGCKYQKYKLKSCITTFLSWRNLGIQKLVKQYLIWTWYFHNFLISNF